MTEPPEPRNLLGVQIHPVTRGELLAILRSWAGGNDRRRRLYYANAHVLNLAYRDPRFRRSLNSADLVIAEGYGAKLGADLVSDGVPEQLATMDWVDPWLAQVAQQGLSVFLLGDEAGVAPACAAKMMERHPALRIVGTHHGYFDKDGPENDEVVGDVNEVSPDVLMVGFGSPLQEYWIDEHISRLDVSLFFSVGAMFRWYAGAEDRAPLWMRELRLEWLHRLVNHPVRHFRRYVVGNPAFMWKVLRQRWVGR